MTFGLLWSYQKSFVASSLYHIIIGVFPNDNSVAQSMMFKREMALGKKVGTCRSYLSNDLNVFVD